VFGISRLRHGFKKKFHVILSVGFWFGFYFTPEERLKKKVDFMGKADLS